MLCCGCNPSRLKSSIRRLTLCVVAVCAGFVSVGFLLSAPHRHSEFDSETHRVSESEAQAANTFLVDTPGCNILAADPWHRSIAKFVKRSGSIHCGTGQQNGSPTYVDGTILRINKTYLLNELQGNFNHCRYQAITRPQVAKTDNVFKYQTISKNLTEDAEMKDEFIRILCYSQSHDILSITFHAFVLPKEEVERRCQLKLRKHLRQNAPREVLNVVMLGVDSVSRMNMIRQMPRTRDFLQNQLQAVELTGYNKVADNTFVNIIPLTTGRFVEEMPWNRSMAGQPFDNFTFIWKNFSEAGYRTLYAEDHPSIAIFHFLKAGFRRPPADYYYRPMALAMENDASVWNHRHHCVGNTLETTVLLNYLTDFSRLFHSTSTDRIKDSGGSMQGSIPTPYFGFTFITRLTHDDVNSAGAADDPYLDFLRRFRDDGRFNNTVLIFFSDHGYRFGELRNTYMGKLEERLPFMFMVLPPWFRSRYPRLHANLQSNAKRLTTPFDVFETLKDILYFDGQDRPASVSQRGISLFRRIPELRSCEHAHISPKWCACLRRQPLPSNSAFAKKASEYVLQEVNRLLSNHRGICAILKLREVLQIEELLPSAYYADSAKDTRLGVERAKPATKPDQFYELTVRTEPGGAVFECTLRQDTASSVLSLAGDVIRINLYGQQASCISDFFLKNFCFCF